MNATLLLLMSILFAQPATQPASVPSDESDAEGNKLRATPNDVHGLHRIDCPFCPAGELLGNWEISSHSESTSLRSITRETEVVTTPFPFNDLLPSWNVSGKGGFAVELRVGRTKDDYWTPWYYLGSWDCSPQLKQKITEDENGFINVDYFQSREPWDRFQFRFHAVLKSGESIEVRHITAAYSNTLNDADVAKQFRKEVDPGPKEKWARRLPIPFRSQKWENERVRGSICSPTSTSMVLEYRGSKHTTEEVYKRVWDAEYRLYGNWWRAVQTAYSFGVPGHVERFGDWNAVKKKIADGQPVIASIKIKRGQMRDAPNRQSNGHLIVIAGFDADGDVLVNDPAADTPEKGMATYHREDMEKVWLANGGVGYILEPTSDGAK